VGAHDDLADLWRWFGEQQFHHDSALYERIAVAVAADDEVLEWLRQAPPAAHLPLVPLAAARYLILGGLDHPLGDVYDGRSDGDAGEMFVDLCRRHGDALLDVMETRRVQTNDCGRSALIGPALSWIAQRDRTPSCLIDVGASAGINLLCHRFRLDYGSHGATGPADSPVTVSCEVRGGAPPIASELPAFGERVGIDRSPIDVTDASDARWLMACVWPDSGRTERVEASIQLAQHEPPTTIAGPANTTLPPVLHAQPAGATAVVMTTWAFGHFTLDERAEFVDLLRAESARTPIVWLSAENAGVVEAFSRAAPDGESEHDQLGVLRFDDGSVSSYPLASVHPHGNWIDWHANPST